jgi:hypothetical protein
MRPYILPFSSFLLVKIATVICVIVKADIKYTQKQDTAQRPVRMFFLQRDGIAGETFRPIANRLSR